MLNRLKILIFAFLSLVFIPATKADIALKVFSSDGCSHFPDGPTEQKGLWRECCVSHDLAYWLGGSYEQRMQADSDLEQCVKQLNQPFTATVMLAGVRAGGSPFWNTTYRWGYGWPYWQGLWPRGYRELSAAEKKHARAMLDNDAGER